VIILDTNVVSEVMRAQPSQAVADWLDAQPQASVFSTTITHAELLYGVALLPAGNRRDLLEAGVRKIFETRFSGRMLPFDEGAALAYPVIAIARRHGGRPISLFDAQIASIAHSRGARLATRNVRDFENCGIEVVNPWGEA
jgi:predicted nucleic acid-binding protein